MHGKVLRRVLGAEITTGVAGEAEVRPGAAADPGTVPGVPGRRFRRGVARVRSIRRIPVRSLDMDGQALRQLRDAMMDNGQGLLSFPHDVTASR